MALKQPRVPEYRGEDAYVRILILFLKDFCQEVWMMLRRQEKELEAIKSMTGGLEGKGGE